MSNIPDLVRIGEDMQKAQEPRILKGAAPLSPPCTASLLLRVLKLG